MAQWLLGLEAIALSGLTIYVIARDFGSDISNHGLLTFLAVVMVGVSVVLWFAAIGIPRGLRWPQAPVTMIEVSILLSCIALFQAGRALLAVPLVLIALSTLVVVVGIRAEDARPLDEP